MLQIIKRTICSYLDSVLWRGASKSDILLLMIWPVFKVLLSPPNAIPSYCSGILANEETEWRRIYVTCRQHNHVQKLEEMLVGRAPVVDYGVMLLAFSCIAVKTRHSRSPLSVTYCHFWWNLVQNIKKEVTGRTVKALSWHIVFIQDSSAPVLEALYSFFFAYVGLIWIQIKFLSIMWPVWSQAFPYFLLFPRQSSEVVKIGNHFWSLWVREVHWLAHHHRAIQCWRWGSKTELNLFWKISNILSGDRKRGHLTYPTE